MKVLLINPPHGMLPAGEKIPTSPGTFPPLGPLYIAAALEQNDINVKVLDADILNLSLEKVIDHIEQERPDVIGITAVTNTIHTAIRIAEQTKKNFPDLKTVIGGVHAFFLWNDIMENAYVDFCIIGEGEYSFLGLVTALEGRGNLRDIKGLVYRKNGIIRSNGPSPRITDLESLPFPARHLLPMKKYKAPYLVEVGGSPYTSVMSSRGCAYKCNYCSSSALWKGRVTFQSPHKVIDELKHIKNDIGVRYFSFLDDTFTINKKRTMEICDLMIEADLNMPWACEARVNTIDTEILKKLKKAGCRGLYMGVEFGNQRMLDFVNKKTTLSMIRNAVEKINNVGGFKTHGFFMIGYPTETKKTVRDTINFAKSLDITAASFFTTMPFPGTKLFEYCKKNNLLITEDWSKYTAQDGESNIKLEDITTDELSDLLVKAHREFYLRPSFIAKTIFHIRSFSDFKYGITQGFKII